MSAVDADLVKRLAELVDGDAWVMADLLLETFTLDDYPDNGSGNNGLLKALHSLHSAVLIDHGVDLSTNTMRLYRATAVKWPRDTRVSRASFKVHRMLKGDDRRERMDRYLKLAERENRNLSADMVKRFRDDESPRHLVTMRETMRRRIATAVKGVLAEGIIKSSLPTDWWNGRHMTDEHRAMAVQELRALADLIEGVTT